MAEITDPKLLAQLNGGAEPGEVTDSAILRRLESTPFNSIVDALVEYGPRALASIGRGTVEGAKGLTAFPGNMTELGANLTSRFSGAPIEQTRKAFQQAMPFGAAPTSQDIEGISQELVDAGVLPEMYTPKDRWEKYLSAGAQGGMSMLGGGPTPQIAALTGILSGVGGEAADQLTGGMPWARPVGNIAGLALSLLRLHPSQMEKVMGPALKELKPGVLENAAAGKSLADARLGTNTLITHQLDPTKPTNQYLLGVTKNAYAGPQGGVLRNLAETEQNALANQSVDAALSPSVARVAAGNKALTATPMGSEAFMQASDTTLGKVLKLREMLEWASGINAYNREVGKYTMKRLAEALASPNAPAALGAMTQSSVPGTAIDVFARMLQSTAAQNPQ